MDEGLLSNLGSLLDNYATDKIVDIATRYSKRNYTAEERYQNSLFCQERYIKEMANYTKSTFSFLQDFLQGTVCNNHEAFQRKIILIYIFFYLEIFYMNYAIILILCYFLPDIT